MQASNLVSSYYGGGKGIQTITSSGSYWGKTKKSKQEILQHRFVCFKSKRGVEGYSDLDVHKQNRFN